MTVWWTGCGSFNVLKYMPWIESVFHVYSVKRFIGFGVGSGANILTRFAVSN